MPNKRIKKKHTPRFSMYMMCVMYNLHKFELILGHKVEHKIARKLSNSMKRKCYKNLSNNKKHEEAFNNALDNFLLDVVEQSFHPMDYYENKSMEVK